MLEPNGKILRSPAVLSSSGVSVGRVTCQDPVHDVTGVASPTWSATVSLTEAGMAVPRASIAGNIIAERQSAFFSTSGPHISGVGSEMTVRTSTLVNGKALIPFKVVDKDSDMVDVDVTAAVATDEYVKQIDLIQDASSPNYYTISLTLHPDGNAYTGKKEADVTITAVDEHGQESTFTFKLVVEHGDVDLVDHVSGDKTRILTSGNSLTFSHSTMNTLPHVTITARRANVKVKLQLYGAGGGGNRIESYDINGGHGGYVEGTFTFNSSGESLYISTGGGGGGYHMTAPHGNAPAAGTLGGGMGGRDNTNEHGSGGGGCTVVSTSPLFGKEHIVALAAGGGGAARWDAGDGGGLTGGDADAWGSVLYGGNGGTQTAPGGAGILGHHSNCNNIEAGAVGDSNGFSGQESGVGGTGGRSCISAGGGGGGGCGWFGGGGGRGYSTYIGSGGGGGGSSFVRIQSDGGSFFLEQHDTSSGSGSPGGESKHPDTVDGYDGKVTVTVLK
jgi:hypothetical protein